MLTSLATNWARSSKAAINISGVEMKEIGVFFREFDDGSYELGVLEDYGSYLVMDVGEFAYAMNYNRFEYPFTWVGMI